VFDLDEELRRLRDAFDKQKIDYAVCGGIALGIHGMPRFTVDIDILIRADDAENALKAAEMLGFQIRARPMSFSRGATEMRRISKIDPVDGETLILDYLLVTPAIEDVWRTRISLPWHGGHVNVVSREGLITLKLLRSSEQDLLDIKNLQREES
jgi:hypothetical protein